MIGGITFISAGAGSGKTYRLTQILHTKLATGKARPSGVIATTFTVKAATELRHRARAYLLGEGEFELATSMDQARIGTVNSVCGELLLRFAFEAGLPTEQRVLGEAQGPVLLARAIDRVSDEQQLGALTELADRLGIERWQDDLKRLVDQVRANGIAPSLLAGMAEANADALLEHFPEAASEDLDCALRGAIDEALPVLEDAIARKPQKNTTEYLQLCRTIRAKLDSGRAAWSDWVKLAQSNPGARLRPALGQLIAIAARHAEHPRLHSDIRSYLKHLFVLCAVALTEYAEHKAELGFIDFVDQEQLLLETLDHAEVQATLRDELDLLLVDEFQDTSPIQLAVFLKLAALAREVYWVGDVKQAIYGFRGSDTALMQAVLESLPSMGGRKEILASSHRSRPPLVALVNAVFGEAFAGLLPREDVQLKAERPEPDTGPAFANWMLSGRNIDEQIVALGLGIRRLLESGCQVVDKQTSAIRPVRHTDIAVLARLNDRVKQVAAGLRAQGVPVATAQPGLRKQPEAVLAIACLRRLNDSRDTIATAEVVSLAECQEPEVWLADRLSYLQSGGNDREWQEAGERVHPLMKRLANLRAGLPLLTPRGALERVVAHCDLPRVVLQWNQSEETARARLANLEALIALAEEYEESCRSMRSAATLSGLLLWLRQQAKDGLDALAEPDLDAVKVLTHHGAKGLEWPIVILMDLGSDVKDRLWDICVTSRSGFDLAKPLEDRFVRYWPWPYGKRRNVEVAERIANTPVGRQVRAAAEDEAQRLLYVSMTRARDMLVIARSAQRSSGEWLDALDAPWLLPDQDAGDLMLPDGTPVPYQRWDLDPADASAATVQACDTLHWFTAAGERAARIPLIIAPSASEPVRCEAGERVQLGTRVHLGSATDIRAVGSALHNCIAAALGSAGDPVGLTEIDAILTGWGLDGKIDAGQVLAQMEALRGWIAQRWPGAKIHCEVPVEACLDNRQILKGQIDLLLDTAHGWVLIDHKANPRGGDAWEETARRYNGQLKLYKDAVEQASSCPVIESWLYFPVSAGAISVSLAGLALEDAASPMSDAELSGLVETTV